MKIHYNIFWQDGKEIYIYIYRYPPWIDVRGFEHSWATGRGWYTFPQTPPSLDWQDFFGTVCMLRLSMSSVALYPWSLQTIGVVMMCNAWWCSFILIELKVIVIINKDMCHQDAFKWTSTALPMESLTLQDDIMSSYSLHNLPLW